MERNSCGDRSKATSIDLQETYGENLSKDSEVSSEKLSIPALSCQVQESVEIPLADALSRVTPLPMERRWNTATHNCS